MRTSNLLLVGAILGSYACFFAAGFSLGRLQTPTPPTDMPSVCREIVSYVDTASPEERTRFFETIKTNHLQATQWAAICTMSQAADVP